MNECLGLRIGMRAISWQL